MARKLYDCMKCPGYCCSYPVIEVKDRDAERIAKHFNMPLAKAEKKFFRKAHGYKRIMRRKKDDISARPAGSLIPRNAVAQSIMPGLPPAAYFPVKAIAAIMIS